jgi:hypothetical protein
LLASFHECCVSFCWRLGESFRWSSCQVPPQHASDQGFWENYERYFDQERWFLFGQH